MNTAFHIATQHDEQAKNSKVVIVASGIIPALARGLGLQNLFPLIPVLHPDGRMYMAKCIHMELFTMVSGQVWLNHHSHTLFPLPNTERTNTA